MGKEIARMAARIVSDFHPELVILFGSQAEGRATADSDVDLLVVVDVKGSKRDMAIEIGVALQDFRIPKDIIVTTPAEFAWRKDVIGTIEHPAFLKGKVLYSRAEDSHTLQ
jgi:predicted nucleotidyltransferase